MLVTVSVQSRCNGIKWNKEGTVSVQKVGWLWMSPVSGNLSLSTDSGLGEITDISKRNFIVSELFEMLQCRSNYN